MPRPWVHNEDGPACRCGNMTVVQEWELVVDGKALKRFILFCFAHTQEASTWYLLRQEAPDCFGDLVMVSREMAQSLQRRVNDNEITVEGAQTIWEGFLNLTLTIYTSEVFEDKTVSANLGKHVNQVSKIAWKS